MTSKIVVNNIESDAGVSTVFFNSDIGGTGGTLNVDGNLNVDGVLSYEDVTNIDSVGIITARDGIRVTSGEVGIDNATPHRKLVVGGGGDIACFGANGGIYFGTSTGGFRNNGAIARAQQAGYHVSGSQVGDLVMAPEADKDLIFSSGSTNTMYERLRVTTGGNIGINEASPDSKFHVNSGAETVPARFESTGAQSRIGFKASGTPSSYHVACGAEANDFIVYTNNTEKLRITSDGKLATNGASSIDCGDGGMHLYLGDGARNDYSTSADGLIIEKNGTTGLSIDPGSSGTANIYFPNESNHSIAQISHNNSTGEFRIRGEDHIILSTNGNTERLRITSAGLVGVGTAAGSSSSTRLVVYEESGNAQTIEVKAKNTGGVGSQPGIRFTAPNNDNIGAVFADVTSDSLNFSTGNFVQRLRIDSNGNLGVNKTPETDWATSYRAIEIGNSSVSAYQGGAYPSIELNMNCRGTQASYGAGWKYILGMRATQIHMPYSGETLFRRANSGSADGAISWNESMRISNDGSLYHRGNNSSTVNNTDGDSLASSGYPAGGATFNKNVSVNNGTSDFGQCMNMVSHTKSVTLDGSTNHNMITIYNREGCFVGHIYVGYSTGGEGANAIYKFYTFYSVNSVTAELGPSRRSSSHTISADITSSADSHTIRVNGTGYSGNVTVGLVFLSAGRSGDNHYGVRYW